MGSLPSDGDPSASLRMTDWGAIPAAAVLSFGCTHSSIRPHSLFHSATLTLPFGHTHSIIRPYPLCHPDRSGGISSSWHKTLLLHTGLQVWVPVCRRSFGFAQDDKIYLVIPTAATVIPTAVEGSPAVGSKLLNFCVIPSYRCHTARRFFGFAQDDRLGMVSNLKLPITGRPSPSTQHPAW